MARDSRESSDHIEFIVQAACDLVLSGNERTIVRVKKGDRYSCLMLKTQRFSSLFRHYAKHHGLKKEALSFTFTDLLVASDTPESIHLQKHDVIVVQENASEKKPPVIHDTTTALSSDVSKLLTDTEFTDVVFKVGPSEEIVRAHRCVLSARSDVFAAMFNGSGRGGMRESKEGVVRVATHSVTSVRNLLSFLYTASVPALSSCTPDELLDMLSISEEYILPELKRLCEEAAGQVLEVGTVGRLLIAAEEFQASHLKHLCLEFVLDNIEDLQKSPSFESDVESCPALALAVVRACASVVAPHRKRRKVSSGGGGGGRGGSSSSSAVVGSSDSGGVVGEVEDE